MKCLSINTASGNPCQRLVGRDGCPNHGNFHVQERLRQANRPKPAAPEQLAFRLTLAEIKALIQAGYDAEKPADPCGCQG